MKSSFAEYRSASQRSFSRTFSAKKRQKRAMRESGNARKALSGISHRRRPAWENRRKDFC
jgi:hypothetical protein